jgi:hypothetical protein
MTPATHLAPDDQRDSVFATFAKKLFNRTLYDGAVRIPEA